MDVETKKMTEGGILSAIQIVLGLILIPTGIGYSLYIELILPITMAFIFLRCGAKHSVIAGMNTLLMVTFGFGNMALAVYAFQSLGIGFLTGAIIEKNQGIQEDLMIESLVACFFVLLLDLMTAKILGYSLLEDDGISDMVTSMIPGASPSVVQVFYYLSIASIPVASVLMTYIGTLVIGYRLGLRQEAMRTKYCFIKHYKEFVPFSYQSKKSLRYALIGMGINMIVWQYVSYAYLKAWIACSSVILAYFVLLDLEKLIGQFIFEYWKKPLLLMVYHLFLLAGLLKAFKWTCWSIMIIGTAIDIGTPIRAQQMKRLAYYMNRRMKNIRNLI